MVKQTANKVATTVKKAVATVKKTVTAVKNTVKQVNKTVTTTVKSAVKTVSNAAAKVTQQVKTAVTKGTASSPRAPPTKILDAVQTGLDIAGLVPGVGEIADGTNALIYTLRGDKTNAALSAAACIPFIGWGAFGMKAVNKGVKALDKAGDVNDVVRRAGKATKADFYVTPSGQAIPSTGYRYMSENAPYLYELNKTKTIPANSNGTYFSFNKYEVASPGKLQVPHDASIRGSFDTLQIIDDIRIPNGNWGKANYLEPITKNFPEFGGGGATQAVTSRQIILNEITKLPK